MKIIPSRLRLLIGLGAALAALSYANGPSPKAIDRPGDQDTISFPSTAPTFDGSTVSLAGRVTKPDGPAPLPAVVLLHGCGGIQPKRDLPRPAAGSPLHPGGKWL